ncbi:low molecular weight phosphatase family protein [Cellulosilyticum ruminicola]|uniref:ArsC family transcriptional regulator n=1 Tax=Cellulosilyticum ruminicola TaxID=425254 RepID=UPI0006CF74E9|nr:ArsC family transcriptional regulator [Cellulosilyticum ruminicola]
MKYLILIRYIKWRSIREKLAGDVFESYSAGTELRPEINQDAVRIIKNLYDIDMNENQKSKLLEDIPEVDVVVVTMGCNVQCSNLPYKYREDWGLEDPSHKVDEAFIFTAKKIEEKILDLKIRIKNNQL